MIKGTGNGDILFMSGGSSCNGSEKIISRNNFFQGDWDYTSGSPVTHKSEFYYAAGSGACASLQIDNKYGIVYDVKETSICPNANNVLCVNPLFQGPFSGDIYGMTLQLNSPAKAQNNLLAGQVVLGTSKVPTYDFMNQVRPTNSITWGAYELGITTEINEIAESKGSIRIYPNPATTNFILQISSEIIIKDGMIQLYDVCGREVKKVSINNNETITDRDEFKNGIYFYNFVNNNEVIEMGKLVFQ